MNAPKSLSQFFDYVDHATLNNCDTEQIHLSGMIQNVGALIAVEPATTRVLAASANIADYLGMASDAVIDRPLAEIDADLAEEIADLRDEPQLLHEVLDFSLELSAGSFDTVTHCHAGLRFIEFVPNCTPSPRVARNNMRLASKTCAQIMHAAAFDGALQIAADAVRQVTGFDRAIIYRFLPDWSGETIAESREDHMASFLGLHFPATDIPKQAREIMAIVPYRAIATTADDPVSIAVHADMTAPIDLTWSVLRSVSRMHTAYLRNMGLNASFSCSLMHQGRHWGVIALHDTRAGMVPFDSWSLIHEIGNALMLRHDQQERANTADKITELRRIESSFAAALRQRGDVEDVIKTLVPVLQDFMSADGFAFQYGTNLHYSGKTPPQAAIREMIQWAIKQRETSDQFQTIAFHREWAPARDHIETACGVLIQPIATHRVCQLIWFRGPITRRVSWAGKPQSKEIVRDRNPLKALGPRNSFEKWVEEHRLESAPWTRSELESAREIFKEFLDIVTAQLLLKEENATLKEFATNAAHDLKAPLRGISNALHFMKDDGFDPEAVRESHALADSYAKRLTDLTSGLLELAVVGEQEHAFETVDLAAVARGAADLLSVQVEEAGAHIEIDQLPLATGNPQLLTRLFLNLIGNALKYRDPARRPQVRIAAAGGTDAVFEIAVSDNGIGIPTEFAAKIFEPMQRLHPQSRIEGAGLGLTICQRILGQHGGHIRIDPERLEGASFVVSLPHAVTDAA